MKHLHPSKYFQIIQACVAALIMFMCPFKAQAYQPGGPFYGIWCQASKDYEEANSYAAQLSSYGYNALVFNTADWSNLNSEPWYAVSAGMYASEGEAQAALQGILKICPDAYVKYTGDYQGNPARQPVQVSQAVPAECSEHAPFYGIWCGASKSFSDIQELANRMTEQGFQTAAFLTTEWSNLNQEAWYVLTAGTYSTEVAAQAILPVVQKYYPDAYVKYSGSFQGRSENAGFQAQEGSQATAFAPFYGIWCQASKSLSEAQQYADDITQQGFYAKVFKTTEWANLNPELWYAVSAGAYSSEAQAGAMLDSVQRIYPDAYVKYSGEYTGG